MELECVQAPQIRAQLQIFQMFLHSEPIVGVRRTGIDIEPLRSGGRYCICRDFQAHMVGRRAEIGGHTIDLL